MDVDLSNKGYLAPRLDIKRKQREGRGGRGDGGRRRVYGGFSAEEARFRDAFYFTVSN